MLLKSAGYSALETEDPFFSYGSHPIPNCDTGMANGNSVNVSLPADEPNLFDGRLPI